MNLDSIVYTYMYVYIVYICYICNIYIYIKHSVKYIYLLNVSQSLKNNKENVRYVAGATGRYTRWQYWYLKNKLEFDGQNIFIFFYYFFFF